MIEVDRSTAQKEVSVYTIILLSSTPAGLLFVVLGTMDNLPQPSSSSSSSPQEYWSSPAPSPPPAEVSPHGLQTTPHHNKPSRPLRDILPRDSFESRMAIPDCDLMTPEEQESWSQLYPFSRMAARHIDACGASRHKAGSGSVEVPTKCGQTMLVMPLIPPEEGGILWKPIQWDQPEPIEAPTILARSSDLDVTRTPDYPSMALCSEAQSEPADKSEQEASTSPRQAMRRSSAVSEPLLFARDSFDIHRIRAANARLLDRMSRPSFEESISPCCSCSEPNGLVARVRCWVGSITRRLIRTPKQRPDDDDDDDDDYMTNGIVHGPRQTRTPSSTLPSAQSKATVGTSSIL
jgi:hypothetical protein